MSAVPCAIRPAIGRPTAEGGDAAKSVMEYSGLFVLLMVVGLAIGDRVVFAQSGAGTPSIEELERQLEVKKAESRHPPKSADAPRTVEKHVTPRVHPNRGPNAGVEMDPENPLKIGEEYYPDASKRANEEGRCVVTITVARDGLITHPVLQESTGFPRLDEACIGAFAGQRMFPAMRNGKAVSATVSVPIMWKLSGR